METTETVTKQVRDWLNTTSCYPIPRSAITSTVCKAERCADLEAQLQQSRDDYETALRENEKTSAQLRDTQHDANNAATLREAAEFARSERDRVEGERDAARADVDTLHERVTELEDILSRYDAASDIAIKGLSTMGAELGRLRAGMEKVRELCDYMGGIAAADTASSGPALLAAAGVELRILEALSIAGVERGNKENEG